MKLSSYTQPQVLTHLRSCVTWPAWLWRVVAGRRRPQSVCRTAGTHSVPSVPGWRSDRCVCPSLRWHRLPVRQTPRPLYPPHARTWFPCRPLETPGSELCVYAEWSVTKISNGLKIIRYWNLSDTSRFTNYYFTYNKSINYKINHIFFLKARKCQISNFFLKSKSNLPIKIYSKIWYPVYQFVPSRTRKAFFFFFLSVRRSDALPTTCYTDNYFYSINTQTCTDSNFFLPPLSKWKKNENSNKSEKDSTVWCSFPEK